MVKQLRGFDSKSHIWMTEPKTILETAHYQRQRILGMPKLCIPVLVISLLILDTSQKMNLWPYLNTNNSRKTQTDRDGLQKIPIYAKKLVYSSGIATHSTMYPISLRQHQQKLGNSRFLLCFRLSQQHNQYFFVEHLLSAKAIEN